MASPLGLPVTGTPLRVNALLADGRVAPDWPSERYAEEYGPRSDHLHLDAPIDERVVRRAAAGCVGADAEVDALARRRVLLDLPERW